MSRLNSLPTELIIQIMCVCSIESTISLSAACRHLRRIWLEHADAIVERMFGRKIAAYEAAHDLAVNEARRSFSQHEVPVPSMW